MIQGIIIRGIDRVFSSYKPGTTISIGFTYDFDYNNPKLKLIKIKISDMKVIKQALVVVMSTLALSSCVKVDLGDDDGTPTGNDGDPNVTKNSFWYN